MAYKEKNILRNKQNTFYRNTNKINDEQHSICTVSVFFDEENGFSTDGSFSIQERISNGKGQRQNYTLKTNRFHPEGVFYESRLNGQSKEYSLDYKQEDLNKFTKEEAVSEMERVVRYEHSYREFDLLFEAFLYEEVFKNDIIQSKGKHKREDVINFINENGLTDDLSSYIKRIVNDYNTAYLNRTETFENMRNEKGSVKPETRFDFISNDERFKKDIEISRQIWRNNIEEKTFELANIRGDKDKSILNLIERQQETMDLIAHELIYRGTVKGIYSNDNFNKKRNQIDAVKTGEYLLKNNIITDIEKEEIKKLEKNLFEGIITSAERKRYREIKELIELRQEGRFSMILADDIRLSSVGLTDLAIQTKRKEDGVADKGIANIEATCNSLLKGIKNYEEIQDDRIKPKTHLEQNQKLEAEIDSWTKMENGMPKIDLAKNNLIKEVQKISDDRTRTINEKSTINTTYSNF